jgi:serine/threonine-protein kinase
MPDGPPQSAQPQGPHPWESQLNAARHRAEQTEVQYLDPNQDPLRRRPRRQPQPGPSAAQQQAYAQPQQQPPAHQQPRYQQPPPQQQQPRYQQPQPQRYEPQRPPPEPAPRREPRRRSANPVKIPGLGCLKGCMTMILVLVVIFLLAWYVGPLQDWFNTGKGLWDSVTGWVSSAWHWVSTINNATNGGGPGGQ